MIISVILPTRKRYNYLVRAMHSLIDTAYDTSRLEFFYAFDSDDEETMEKFKQYVDKVWPDLKMNFLVFKERYGWSGTHKYLNDMIHKTNGEWVLSWSDDAVMHTREWDKLIEEKYKDRFCIVASKILHHECNLPIFPLFPKKYYEVQGNFLSGDCPDLWLGTVSHSLGILVDDNEIIISHFAMQKEKHGSINHLFWNAREVWQKDMQKLQQYINTLPPNNLEGFKKSSGHW